MGNRIWRFIGDWAAAPSGAAIGVGAVSGDWHLIVIGVLTFVALRARTDTTYRICEEIAVDVFKTR